MTIIQSIDPGLVNLSISTFKVKKNGKFKLKKMEVLQIKNFRGIAKFLLNDADCIIVEKQPFKSKLYGISLFIEGWCKAKNINFKNGRACDGKTYKERKLNSIQLLYERDEKLFNNAKPIFGKKLDDISDSFNIGYNVISKDNEYYHSSNTTLFSYKNKKS